MATVPEVATDGARGTDDRVAMLPEFVVLIMLLSEKNVRYVFIRAVFYELTPRKTKSRCPERKWIFGGF